MALQLHPQSSNIMDLDSLQHHILPVSGIPTSEHLQSTTASITDSSATMPTTTAENTTASTKESQLPPVTAGAAVTKAKKKLIVACIGCRKKKIKCSSNRPACTNCLRLNIPCEYPVIRNRGSRFGYIEMLNRRMQHLQKYIQAEKKESYKIITKNANIKFDSGPEAKRGNVNSGFMNIKSIENAQSLITQLGPSILIKELTPPPGDSTEPAANSTNPLGSGELPNMNVTLHLIELYFRNIHGQTYNFLHKPTFIPKVKKGKVNPTLLLALCGLTSRYSRHPAITCSTPYEAGEVFMDRAKKRVANEFDEPSLETVQAIIFIVQNEFFKSKSKKAMIYVALAIRMATHLELHIDKSEGLGFVEKEERRRTFWSLAALDRLAHSAPHWKVQLRIDVNIQLPCKDYFYENNIAVDALTTREYEKLSNANEEEREEMMKNRDFKEKKDNLGIYAYNLLGLALWSDINKYVMENYKKETIAPWLPGSLFNRLQTKLQNIIDLLPPELHYKTEKLAELDTINQASAFVHLHSALLTSVCCLYRSMYPFNTKLFSTKFKDSPPKAFLQACAHKIMTSATQQSQIVADFLATEDLTIAPFIGFGVFTVSSVHIANSFSKNATVAMQAKNCLAINLKLLVIMREYYYTVGVWCIILKNRYFQKAKCHSGPTASLSLSSSMPGLSSESPISVSHNMGSRSESNSNSASRKRLDILAQQQDPEDGFSRPGSPPVAYAPEELMELAANEDVLKPEPQIAEDEEEQAQIQRERERETWSRAVGGSSTQLSQNAIDPTDDPLSPSNFRDIFMPSINISSSSASSTIGHGNVILNGEERMFMENSDEWLSNLDDLRFGKFSGSDRTESSEGSVKGEDENDEVNIDVGGLELVFGQVKETSQFTL